MASEYPELGRTLVGFVSEIEETELFVRCQYKDNSGSEEFLLALDRAKYPLPESVADNTPRRLICPCCVETPHPALGLYFQVTFYKDKPPDFSWNPFPPLSEEDMAKIQEEAEKLYQFMREAE